MQLTYFKEQTYNTLVIFPNYASPIK